MNNNLSLPNTKNGTPFNDQIINILLSAGNILNKSKNFDLKPIFKAKKDIVTKIDILKIYFSKKKKAIYIFRAMDDEAGVGGELEEKK